MSCNRIGAISATIATTKIILSDAAIDGCAGCAARGGALRPPRIELFFKTPAELKERLRALTAAGYGSFNLVNKDKKDPMLAWVDVCCEELGPGHDVCAHFSSKYNARGGPALAERLEALAARSQSSGIELSTLVVSGSGAQKRPLC